MNFFQRLSFLKNWYEENHTLYLENRKILKTAFDKKYKNELRRYTTQSKKIKQKRDDEIAREKSISFQDWVEVQFQILLQNLSQTIVDFQKSEHLEYFDNWLKDFAPLDYKFRVYTIELYYKVELARFNSQFDMYILALKKGHTDWLFTEDERFKLWADDHPLYEELQELEFQYDALEEDDAIGQNYAFNRKSSKIANTINSPKTYKPTTKENVTISVEKPSVVEPHRPSYF